MKVAVELQPCLKNRSGIGIYTYELSKRLQYKENVEIYGDIFNFMGRNDLDNDLAGLDFPKETCRLFPYGVYRRIWHCLPIRYNKLFKRKVELTHFFNFIVPPRIEGKVINTIYDMTFIYYPETMDRRNLKRLKDDIVYSVERADHIITISQCSKTDMMKELGIPEEKIDIVYPGVDFEHFNEKHNQESVDRVRKKYNLPPYYILYMGTLEPRKNIPTLIEAFHKLKQSDTVGVRNIKLVIAGRKGWLFEEIFHKVKAFNLEEEIIFTDYVAEEDKAIIYSEAKLFVFPSLYEGFGIPVLEAMAAGVPVITSNTASLPEVAQDAAILINPLQVDELEKAMAAILKDEKLCGQLIEKGLKQARKFNWDESAERLVQVYKKVLTK